MQRQWPGILAGATVILVLGSPGTASAQFYRQHNLVSDGSVAADLVDPDLVNAWGLTASPTSPWWVSDNGTDLSTLYNGNTGAKLGLVVSVPGAPSGDVFNASPGPEDFLVSPGGPKAVFLFATEEGTIRAWNPALGSSTTAPVDNGGSAIYKGLTLAITPDGGRLYATNFKAGVVEVYDPAWTLVTDSMFQDPALPPGYAPFGIQAISGSIFVTYALQDENKEDDVAGPGHGFVDQFDLSGHLTRRVASGGVLNSPWGLALAPDGFGKYNQHLLVGNFGDGKIHAFDPSMLEGTGAFQLKGQLHSADGRPLVIDGLWALQFGNGAAAGPRTTLFFTAGPNDEADGLFGSLEVAHPNQR